MNKGEKIKVYFKMDGRYYTLFNVIQMGANGMVDLKITDFYNKLVIATENVRDDEKGYLTETEMRNSRFVHKTEMSYHQDGSCLHKLKDEGNREYSNPYGEGERWTPTDKISDFQPIFHIAIRRMEIYNKSYETPILKSKEVPYICDNADLFEKKESYLVICYIRNKNFTINRFTTSKVYSDIIASLNQKLDLCIFIQKYSYPMPKPYYDEHFKGLITPYLNNSINFCNKEYSKEEMMDKLRNSVFNPDFNHFLYEMTNGNFFNFTEEKLQLIDQVNIFTGKGGKLSVSTPVFIKLVLSYLNDKLADFNKHPTFIKQALIQKWNSELEHYKTKNSH